MNKHSPRLMQNMKRLSMKCPLNCG